MKLFLLPFVVASAALCGATAGYAQTYSLPGSTALSPGGSVNPSASVGPYGWSENYDAFTYPNGYNPYNPRIQRSPYAGIGASTRLRFTGIYFPPPPPVLGAPLLEQRHGRLVISPERDGAMLDVYEPFYISRLILENRESLSEGRRAAIEAHRAERRMLLAELRARLASLEGADPAARARSLAAFAQEQAARLSELEATADRLREQFAKTVLFWLGDAYWRSSAFADNSGRVTYVLNLSQSPDFQAETPPLIPGLSTRIVWNEAAFQRGFSPDQRRLLREVAMDLDDRRGVMKADRSVLVFSPATSRFPLPADLPEAVMTDIAAYRAEKAVLKTELRHIVVAERRTLFDFARVNALRALAEKQAPRFAGLEALAEEIRVGLAAHAKPLPLSALDARLLEIRRRKTVLQTKLLDRLEEMKKQLPHDRVVFRRAGESYRVTIVPGANSTEADDENRRRVRASLADFNASQNHAYAALDAEKAVLNTELARAAGRQTGSPPPKDVDRLLAEFPGALSLQENAELYREYRIAVLEPGLSPAQRRLLFGATLEVLGSEGDH